MQIQQSELWGELLAAVQDYEAAKKQIESWSIVLDEGDPVTWRDRVALDGLYKKKNREYDWFKAARDTLLDVAIKLSHVVHVDDDISPDKQFGE